MSLLEKDVIENAIESFVGRPLHIGHEDRTRHGEITSAAFDAESGWFWCEGVAETEEVQNAIKKMGATSCAYVPTKTGEGSKWHNIPYNERLLGIMFTHLAVVDPAQSRYEDASIILNSKSTDSPMKNATKWILKKLGLDGKTVETSGDIPTTDERLNSLVELYRTKTQAAGGVPEGAFVEIDGKQVAMSDLLALEVANTAETPEAKTQREAAEKLAADEVQNARDEGYKAFVATATARSKAHAAPEPDEQIVAPDTLASRCKRGVEIFGGGQYSAANYRSISGRN